MKQFYELLFQQEVLYQIYSKPLPMPTAEEEVVEKTDMSEKTTPIFRHQVLVLIDEPVGIAPSDAIFLQKVMEAVKVDMNDVEILNVANGNYIDFRPVLQGKKVNKIISFGVPFIKINLEILTNRYEPKVAGGVKFLFSESLGIVQADRQNKQALWNALKVIFFQ